MLYNSVGGQVVFLTNSPKIVSTLKYEPFFRRMWCVKKPKFKKCFYRFRNKKQFCDNLVLCHFTKCIEKKLYPGKVHVWKSWLFFRKKLPLSGICFLTCSKKRKKFMKERVLCTSFRKEYKTTKESKKKNSYEKKVHTWIKKDIF